MLGADIITKKRIKLAAICFVIFVAIIVLHVIITNLSHLGKVPVEIKYAPFEAQVFIDDQNYPKNNAINWLEPGPHRIMVVMNGFKTIEEDIEITAETKHLYGTLEALNTDSNELYQKYQADYIQVEGVAGKTSKESAERLVQAWPILEYLPYIKDNYALGTQFDENDNLVVTVRAASAQIDNAINKLRSFTKTTLSEYNIKIQDFTNVLEGQFVNNNTSDPAIFLANGYQNLGLPFQVNTGQQLDDYYITTISVGKYAGYIPVTYRAVLQKTNNSWRLLGTPYPLLTIYNTKNVDPALLNAANQLNAPSTVSPDSSGDGH